MADVTGAEGFMVGHTQGWLPSCPPTFELLQCCWGGEPQHLAHSVAGGLGCSRPGGCSEHQPLQLGLLGFLGSVRVRTGWPGEPRVRRGVLGLCYHKSLCLRPCSLPACPEMSAACLPSSRFPQPVSRQLYFQPPAALSLLSLPRNVC